VGGRPQKELLLSQVGMVAPEVVDPDASPLEIPSCHDQLAATGSSCGSTPDGRSGLLDAKPQGLSASS